MKKRNSTVVYGVVGACGGAASLVSAAGGCSAGGCAACFRCIGMVTLLVALALFHRARRGREQGTATGR